MPERPDSLAQIYMAFSDPLWQGVIMAAVTSFLRVLYDARETRPWRIVLELLICCCLSLMAFIVIESMAWPPGLSVAAGGAIGFLGVTAMRETLLRVINRKTDST